ncbi:MAG TPA: ribonuclease T2 [Pseudolabrys sp.]|nr:ribonuclease T2 [Pseudolabrys sp.]
MSRGALRRLNRAAQAAAISLSFLLLFAIVALAQDRRQNTPGQFDFYVLALSWSPSFCEATQERAPDRPPDQQCSGRPFSFVVHGLWPQYAQGFPSFCQVPSPRLDRSIVSGMLDLMPSPRLIFHEWERHGTCSGLSPHAYFELVRKARAVIKIPGEFLALDKPISVKPDEVADAFVKANAGLSRADVAVTCDSKRLSEVRVCLNKDFSFHNCPEVTRRACKRDSVALPAMRGG